MKIKEIIQNTKTGQVYVKTNQNKTKKCLYKDGMGYFIRNNNFVERLTEKKDIERIKSFLK
jgi:hypothetical protein